MTTLVNLAGGYIRQAASPAPTFGFGPPLLGL